MTNSVDLIKNFELFMLQHQNWNIENIEGDLDIERKAEEIFSSIPLEFKELSQLVRYESQPAYFQKVCSALHSQINQAKGRLPGSAKAQLVDAIASKFGLKPQLRTR